MILKEENTKNACISASVLRVYGKNIRMKGMYLHRLLFYQKIE
jgi:hypothetical protein